MPGPGTYNLLDGIGGSGGRQCTLKAKINYDFEMKRDASPGPCAY